MNTETLRAFVVAAKHSSLTLAASELGLSQPAISKQLSALENKLGAKLYERNGHGIKVTPAGELLLKETKLILEKLEKLPGIFARRAAQSTEQSQRLRVAGSFMLSTIVLPELLARFQKFHPNVDVELVTGSQEQVEAHVSGSDFELGFSTQKPRSTNFQSEPFRRERLVFFVAVSHPLAKKLRVTRTELRAEPIIARGDVVKRGVTSAVLHQLKQSGLAINVKQHFNSPIAVRTAVGRKMGVGLLFEDIVAHAVKNGEFKILKGHGLKVEGTSYILQRKDRKLSPIALEFLDLARGAGKRAGGLPR